jgi:hypothetical protein
MNPAYLEHLKRDVSPVKPLRPTWQYFVLALLLATAVSALGVSAMGTAGWRTLSPLSWAFIGPALLTGIAVCAWAASQWLSPTGKANLGMAAAALGVAWAGLFVAWEPGEYSLSHAIKCFRIASFFSLVASIGCLALFRQGTPLRRHASAVAAGLFSGFVGFLVIQTLCPIRDLGHLLSGHGIVPICWGLAAYWLVRLFSKA